MSAATASKKLFLSAVSSEFISYRELLSGDLMRPDLDVAVQEDFGVTDRTTLEKLDTYILHCDAIIHLIGKATGAVPEEPAVAALLAKYPDFGTRLPPLADRLRQPQPGFSYTQWEAYLALYHQRPVYIYLPTDFASDPLVVPRHSRFVFRPAEFQAQKEHHQRICDLGHDRGLFANEERLSSAVLRDLVKILPQIESRTEVIPTRLRHTAERLVGRDDELTLLDAAWNDPHKHVVIVRAFGGMGKTSLVATWMAELALKNWRGAERVFDWSFYSQGTRDQSAASADTFIAAALRAFGDPDPTLGSPWDRGARLAHLVGKARCLLVLDGLEPLQYPPGPTAGKLRDQGVEALLKGLVARNAGLCVVTTREKVPDIQQHYGRAADDVALTQLSDRAGAALLHNAGARRAGAKEIAADDRELQAASREVRGHGLTLQLLGQYLRLVEGGDILKRGTVRLADADHEYQNDATRPYGHAFKAMEAYEKWFAAAGPLGQRQLAILKLLGLFDRPASKGCLDALRAAPVIAGLTEPLVGLDSRDWKLALKRLEDIHLLTVQEDGSIDCHPLLREYFAQQLREKAPAAWREAHKRLYEHLCETTKEGDQPTLEDLQPLYQAVAHGCQAGLQQEACDKVYYDRIMRGDEHYTWFKLGAFGSELGAHAWFFATPWSRVSSAVTEADQAWLMHEAAFCLRALGRLTEALEPMRVSGELKVDVESWKSAATSYGNLSELELTLGEVPGAVGHAEQSVTYADRSGNAFERLKQRTKMANASYQAGRRTEAEVLFREAEQIQTTDSGGACPLLYSQRGFQYCDLLLTETERAAWQRSVGVSPAGSPGMPPGGVGDETPLELTAATGVQRESCRAVSERAAQSIKIAERNNWLLDIALDHLTFARAAFYVAILEHSSLAICHSSLANAVSGLRRAGHQDELPKALLTRAWLRALTHLRTGPDSAQSDLDEAWEIAERGSMRLHMADIHLHRARLFFREANYPWESPQHDLAEARRLIETCGYWRRKEELEDAEAAILGKPPGATKDGSES
jgi:hypothetical protein